jgi:hypothetical protein
MLGLKNPTSEEMAEAMNNYRSADHENSATH